MGPQESPIGPDGSTRVSNWPLLVQKSLKLALTGPEEAQIDLNIVNMSLKLALIDPLESQIDLDGSTGVSN